MHRLIMCNLNKNYVKGSFCSSTDASLLKSIWKPSAYIHNLSKMQIKKAYENQEVLNIIKSSPSQQTIMFYTEIEITLACPMTFMQFPFDEQTCDFNLMDMGLNSVQNMKFNTKVVGLGQAPFSSFKPTVREFEYELLPAINSEFVVDELDGRIVANTGFRIRLVRNYSKYFIMYYIPTSNCFINNFI